jgi:hypothetical protein
MSNAFTLHPDIALLEKYEYTYMPFLEIDAVWKEEQRISIEEAFKALVEKYNIVKHYDTLLYICLVESNDAELKLNHIHDTYKNYNRVKELAQLLLLYKPDKRHRPTNLKVSGVMDTVKLTDKVLVEWVGTTIKNAIEELAFNPSELGESVFSFIATDDGSIGSSRQPLNYAIIERLANQTKRKPGIRERNKNLSNFLLRVWNFVDNETILTTEPGVRFSDHQLNFLFKVAELFEWLKGIDFDSEDKDYIYTLLGNRIKL